MSRKLSSLKKEVARLRKATGVDDKGTNDNFLELTLAVHGLLPGPTDVTDELETLQQGEF